MRNEQKRQRETHKHTQAKNEWNFFFHRTLCSLSVRFRCLLFATKIAHTNGQSEQRKQSEET